MSSVGLLPSLTWNRCRTTCDDVLAAQGLDVEVGADAELLVDHEAADAGQVVAARVHEHAAEQRARRLHRGRIARAQPPVDLDQRLVGVLEVVARERLVERGVGLARHQRQQLEGRPPAAPMIWASRVAVISWLVSTSTSPVSESTTRPPVRRPTSDSALTGILVTPASTSFSIIFGLSVLPAWTSASLPRGRLHVVGDLGPVVDLGGELHPRHPVLEGQHLLRLVELAEDLLVGEDHALLEEPERAQERGGQHLAPPVHPHVEDVVGVELELHPGAAVGDDPRREQQLARGDRLALVVVEEHAGRALELGDHHPLGAVDDEGALLGHQRQLAEIDLLLPHLADGLGLGLLVVVDDLEAQRDLERDREGHARGRGTPPPCTSGSPK